MPYTSKTGKEVPDYTVAPHKWVHGDPKECKICAPCAPCGPICGKCRKCQCCDVVCDPIKLKCKDVCTPHCKACQGKCNDLCKPICEPCKVKVCDPCKATCDAKCPKECIKCGPACGKMCVTCKCNPECITVCDGICGKCKAPCAPICGACKLCDKLCEVGPGIECKTVGCELTLGIPALEAQCGVWHIATDRFPKPLPAILYPCCLPGSGPCCPGGKDEENKGDNFSIGGPSTSGESIKLVRYCCGSMSPYTMLKSSVFGLALDPPFGGEPPAWYSAVPAEPSSDNVVSASNFGSGESCCNHGSLCANTNPDRVPSQIAM